MIDPSDISDALVTLLRTIPGLVAEMGGDEDRIFAYHDRYPDKVSLSQAIYESLSPSVMVAWQGTVPGSFGGNDVWKHQFSLFLRAHVDLPGDPPTAYYKLFRLITKGVPGGAGQPMNNREVHASCYSMDIPSIQRQTDEQNVDYFEVTLSFTEIGDE